MPRPPHLPDYRSPPINEVVIGGQYVGLPITGAHVGRFWERVLDQYPRVEEQPSLEQPIETLAPRRSGAQLQFSMEPHQSRHWLISANDAELLQIQPDRFLFNWRARPDAGEYPHFEIIHEKFRQGFEAWRKFIGLELRLTQWEVTYVNRIGAGDQPPDLGGILSFIGPQLQEAIGGPPEAARFDAQLLLRSSDGDNWARGYVSAKNGFGPRREPLVLLELTVRGPQPSSGGAQAMYDRQFQAREWIVRAFDKLTTDEQHKIWGRK